MIVVLTGGTGGAKFIEGLAQVVPPEEITVIVNTGDDLIWWGLYASPDVDSILYVLAGMLSKDRGWGVNGDTFQCQGAMARLGSPSWFSVGDRDLATHLTRTLLRSSGKTLTETTAEMARRLGVKARVLPMSDQRVETRVDTPAGDLSFEEYFVQRWYQDPVSAVRFAGIDEAQPAPGVLDALQQADTVLLAPSNPVTSIGPILAVPGIRAALLQTKGAVAAVSPIIGEKAVSGPAGILMEAVGLSSSIGGVAHAYADFLDLLVVDEADTAPAEELRQSGLRVHCAKTIMKTAEQKVALARCVLQAVSSMRPEVRQEPQ